MHPPSPQTPGHDTPGAHGHAAAPTYPVDALVTTLAGVVFVTTGQHACDSLGEFPAQVALTPLVARRIAQALRDVLPYPGLEERLSVVAAWQAEELPHVPHGRLELDFLAVRFGIEPLGAGTLVAVRWEHVPGLILQLEAAAAAV